MASAMRMPFLFRVRAMGNPSRKSSKFERQQLRAIAVLDEVAKNSAKTKPVKLVAALCKIRNSSPIDPNEAQPTPIGNSETLKRSVQQLVCGRVAPQKITRRAADERRVERNQLALAANACSRIWTR
jgi:hypothetical protein